MKSKQKKAKKYEVLFFNQPSDFRERFYNLIKETKNLIFLEQNGEIIKINKNTNYAYHYCKGIFYLSIKCELIRKLK